MRWTARWLAYALAFLGGIGLAHATVREAPAPGQDATHRRRDARSQLGAMPTAGPHAGWSPEEDPRLRAPEGSSALAEHLRDGRIITGATPHRLILFTFDDGPDRRTTPLLLDRLDAAGVRAVFFLTGARLLARNIMEREQALLAKEIARRGHVLGSHTLDHLPLPLLTDADALAQITSVEQVFERVLGERPWLLRPPYGAHSPRIDRILAQRGYTTVMWNLGTGDFQVRTADEVVATWKRVLERREREYGERGGIVLLHDTYPWSVDAFQRIVADLWERNCALLTQGEELYDIVDDPSLFHVPRLEAPPHAEAPPARLDPNLLAERQAALRDTTAARCRHMAAL